MNPFFQAKVPSPKEMWKNEPNKFRQWVILFGVSLVIFALLLIISIVLMSIQYNDIKNELAQSLTTSSTSITQIEALDAAKKIIIFRMIGSSAFTALLLIISITLYFITVFRSYKAKSFAKVSAFSIYFSEFVGFFALMFVIFLFTSIANGGAIIKNNSGILIWIIAQIFSITLFVFAWQVSKIRKSFAYSERMEQLQRDPNFQQMQQQMNNMFNQNAAQNSNSYGPANVTPETETTKANVKETTPPKEETKEVKELKKLKVKELNEIASQLSISGYESMTKKELIEIIIRVTGENNQ